MFSVNVIKKISTIILSGMLLSGCGSNEEIVIPFPFQIDESKTGILKNEEIQDPIPLLASELCVLNDDVNNEEGNSYTSASSAVFNITGQEVVYADNVFEKIYPASTTKIMTAIVALKYGNLTDQVVVTEKALDLEPGSSICNFKVGDKPTLEQCLYGLILKSGNDAANAIAEYIGNGDTSYFVELMNEEARKIGAVDTHFMNPSGLHHEEHYTTAYDLYLMFQEALKYDLFETLIKEKTYRAVFETASGEVIGWNWKSTNQYLTKETSSPETVYVIGGKTGTTQAAGNCLVLLSENDLQERNITIVMKSDTKTTLYVEMNDLLAKTMK